MATNNPSVPADGFRTSLSVSISTAADGTSDDINLTGYTLSSVQMSTAWTDAGLGFKGNTDGSTNYYDVYGSVGGGLTGGTSVHLVFPTSASRVLAFDPAAFAGLQNLKLVSETTAGVAVAQAAARTLVLGLFRKK